MRQLCAVGRCRVSKNGFYVRKSDRRVVQRYRCRRCGSGHSASTGKPCYRQKKRQINRLVYRELASLKSLRRTAKHLGVTLNTILRKKRFLGQECKRRHELALEVGLFETQEIQFDEMESFVHTRCKPVSIALAVNNERKILSFELSPFRPTSPRLAKIAQRKYGFRPDLRSRGVRRLLAGIEETGAQPRILSTDQNPRYPGLIRTYFSNSYHQASKGREPLPSGFGELKVGPNDPLFALNHTAAMLRANVSCLIRKTWCTSKNEDGLRWHLYIYLDYHNRVLT